MNVAHHIHAVFSVNCGQNSVTVHGCCCNEPQC